MRLWLLPLLPIGAHGAPAAAAEVFGGIAAHDLNIFGVSRRYETGADLVAGVRSGPIAHIGRASLRLHLLGSANLGGGLSYFAAGAAIRLPAGRRFYLQPGLGIAVHTGNGESRQLKPDELYLGSRLVFEPEFAAGVRLSDRWAAEIAYVHLSHAHIFGPQNPGLDTLGVRLTYRLGR